MSTDEVNPDTEIELLIYAPAYERLKARISDRVKALVMQADGSVTRDGTVLEREQIKPAIAWANRDLYNQGPVRDFMVACLKSSALTWFQSSAAGFEHPVFAKLHSNGVTLTNSNASAVPIAEFVFAQVLTAFHPTVARRQAQAEKRWETFSFKDVHNSRWLIYGLGHVGHALALRARAFGAHVTGCRRTPTGAEPVDAMVAENSLSKAVHDADVVVLSAALNTGNRHIVNQDFIQAMSEDTILVNIGRGGLVDENALLAGLDEGRPSIAILDVFAEEPLPSAHPFWHHPKVRITAHCAGYSEGSSVRGEQIFLHNLERYLSGQALTMQVTEPETV
ncbi:MAG: hypothetical protein GKR94_10660 [Gammaproteobacteria bacterium]|nr:hypothetical protein [Gammaproteobacteria bacterium]